MFEKVLVAEDQEIANLSLRITLQELHISKPDFAHYCDHALTMIRTALAGGKPYDLLVTDLSFETEEGAEQLADGAALIKAAKAIQPNLKILVFSAENRPAAIQSLFDKLGIDGFVRKARGDAQELKTALGRIGQNRQHYPRDQKTAAAQQNLHTFSDYDKTIIRLLAEGRSQKAIPTYLSAHGILPSGLSSVEKRLNFIKTAMGFLKNEQLVAFCKEIGII
jgi:two-component system capsular synthesis response regulator RcsB